MNEHVMTAETTYPGEVLFACPVEGCGRKVVVRPGSMVVLDRGDFFARHVGSVGPVEMSVSVVDRVAAAKQTHEQN